MVLSWFTYLWVVEFCESGGLMFDKALIRCLLKMFYHGMNTGCDPNAFVGSNLETIRTRSHTAG